MDPDETQMFVEAYWWRWEMEDRMQAHYASQHLMAAGVKKDKVKPKKIRFLSEWHGEEDSSDDDSEKELEREKSASSQKTALAKPSPAKPSAKKRSAEDEKAAFKRLKEYSKQRSKEHRGG